MAIQKVKAVRDESSHWYVIPNELYDEFNTLSNLLAEEPDNLYELEEEFNKKFSQYMTGGDLNNKQLYSEI